MAENPHFRELLQVLNDFEVRYLIVGGYAIMKHTEPRYTKDLDVWVEKSAENASRVFSALKRFGAPVQADGITPETFSRHEITYQIGVAPIRIDILTQITGVEFSAAWTRRVGGTIFGIPVSFLSRDDLVANKRATGRSSDLEQLKQISQKMENRKKSKSSR
jgi:predicted nucleotidyltransferase